MTTHRRTWQKRESTAAGLFGATRTPLSGSNGGQTSSDSLHPTIYIETKLRARSPIHTLFDKTSQAAKIEGKTPCLALAMKNRPGFLVVAKAEDIPVLAAYMADSTCPCAQRRKVQEGE